MKSNAIPVGVLVCVVVMFLFTLGADPAQAGKNAGGALIVHTDDTVNYTFTGDYCGVDFDDPGTCENAGTRTDKDENTPAVIWFLAAFPDTSSPGVSVIYFGIDHNLPQGQGYIPNWDHCGPAGSLEVPDGGWPDDPSAGNSLAFGSPIADDILFPFYWLAAYGFEGAYVGTAINPTGEYAAFVDDSNPGVQDVVTKFGTVEWYATGANDCPASGGGGDGGGEGDGGTDEEPGGGGDAAEWINGDGETYWVADRIVARLREDIPMPPRGPVARLGIPSFDSLGVRHGMVSVQRVLRLSDSQCSRFPIGSRVIRVEFRSNTDEKAAARQFAQLSEVVWSEPDYASPTETYSERIDLQWYMLESGQTSCLVTSLDSCCEECEIGIDTAWEYSRGSSSVNIAFYDVGADMQHPDLFNIWARNPDPREDANSDSLVQLCPSGMGGDIDTTDADGNGIEDDVVLGYSIDPERPAPWNHGKETHGTAVAGLLGAITNNDIGIASVAGGNGAAASGIRLIQFSRSPHLGSMVPVSDIYGTFHYARDYGARVYSTSVAIPDATIIREAVAELADSMLFVCAMGNNNLSHPSNPFSRIPDVMAVGGYECEFGQRWIVPGGVYGSDYGREMSLLGPANYNSESVEPQMVMASTAPATVGEYQCIPDSADATDCFGGTSAAAPIVASIAALLFSYSDEQAPPLDLTARQVRKIIERTAEDILCDSALDGACGCANPSAYCADSLLGWDRFTGYGRVDAGRAFTFPTAALDSLYPYNNYLVAGETALLKWEFLSLAGYDADHFTLHYWDSEETTWFPIADSLGSDAREFVWIVPDTIPIGAWGYVRLGVEDAAGVWNHDYRRFVVRDDPLPASALDTRIVSRFRLRPNPSSETASIDFELSQRCEVELEVFDCAGRRVAKLLSGVREAGYRHLAWNGHDASGHRVASGVYFVQLRVGEERKLARLLLIR